MHGNFRVLSIGIQGFDKPPIRERSALQAAPPLLPVALKTQSRSWLFDILDPGDPGDKVLSQVEIGPAASLVCAEEPQISGDIVLDSHFAPTVANASSIEMSLQVDTDGELSARGVIVSAGTCEEFALRPKAQNPASFFKPRSHVDVNADLVPVIYA